MNYPMIVPITDLRRRFGEITAKLPEVGEILLTKGGRPFATLKATGESKKEGLRKFVGIWKGTELDSDEFWEKTLVRKSRSAPVKF